MSARMRARTAVVVWLVVVLTSLIEPGASEAQASAKKPNKESEVEGPESMKTITIKDNPGKPTFRVEFLPGSAKPPEFAAMSPPSSSQPRVREWVTMMKSTGEAFNCSLPETEPASDEDGEEGANGHQEPTPPPRPPPGVILKPLHSTCLFRVEGWWTYEYCHGKHVRQFHVEGKAVVAEFSLGLATFDISDDEVAGGDGDASGGGGAAGTKAGEAQKTYKKEKKTWPGKDGAKLAAEDQAIELVPADKHLPFKTKSPAGDEIYSSRFTSGTTCDLTKRPRETVVYYECAPDNKHTVFTSIQETATCEYVVVISTPLLCRKDGQGKDTNDFAINCYALDPEEALALGRAQASGQAGLAGAGEGGEASADEPLWERAKLLDSALGGDTSIEEIEYKLGDCFRHQKYGYRGVIVAADPVCLQTDAWIARMGVDKLKGGRNQPFYHVFVDERDRKGGQVTYVAQENVKIEKLEEPIQHPLVKDLFTGFVDGKHVPRPDVSVSLMPADPEDVEATLEDILDQLREAGGGRRAAADGGD